MLQQEQLASCTDSLAELLHHKDRGIRVRALKQLDRLAQKSVSYAAEVVAVIRGHQEDRDAEVRMTMVDLLHSLAKSSPSGKGEAVRMLLDRLADWDSSVRQLTVDVLAQVVPKEDEMALETVREQLKSWRAEVRRTAIRALSVLSRPDDEQCVRALCECLEDHDAAVREAAVRALDMLCSPGTAQATAKAAGELERRLQGGQSHVRQAAVIGLAAVSQRGVLERHGRLRGLLLERASDPEVTVRRAAVAALEQLSKPGDLGILNALCARLGAPAAVHLPLEDPGSGTSSSGSEAPQEESEAVTGRPPPLEFSVPDSDWCVRRAAVQALQHLSHGEDERVMEVVAMTLQDSCGEVRRAAKRALVALQPSARSRAASRTAKCLAADASADVRMLGIQTLSYILPPGDKHFVARLVDLLTHHSEGREVRQAALLALGCSAAASCVTAAVVEAVLRCTEDQSADVRLTALGVLPRLLSLLLQAEEKGQSEVSRDIEDSGEPEPDELGQAVVTTLDDGSTRLAFTIGAEEPELGATFAPAGEPAEDQDEETALVVRSVGIASWAARAGLEPGDEVLEVNGRSLLLAELKKARGEGGGAGGGAEEEGAETEGVAGDLELEAALASRPLSLLLLRRPAPAATKAPGRPAAEVQAAVETVLAERLRDREPRVRCAATQAQAELAAPTAVVPQLQGPTASVPVAAGLPEPAGVADTTAEAEPETGPS